MPSAMGVGAAGAVATAMTGLPAAKARVVTRALGWPPGRIPPGLEA